MNLQYKCLACKYRFKKDKPEEGLVLCPYCGKRKGVSDSQNEAQKLLDDVDGM